VESSEAEKEVNQQKMTTEVARLNNDAPTGEMAASPSKNIPVSVGSSNNPSSKRKKRPNRLWKRLFSKSDKQMDSNPTLMYEEVLENHDDGIAGVGEELDQQDQIEHIANNTQRDGLQDEVVEDIPVLDNIDESEPIQKVSKPKVIKPFRLPPLDKQTPHRHGFKTSPRSKATLSTASTMASSTATQVSMPRNSGFTNHNLQADELSTHYCESNSSSLPYPDDVASPSASQSWGVTDFIHHLPAFSPDQLENAHDACDSSEHGGISPTWTPVRQLPQTNSSGTSIDGTTDKIDTFPLALQQGNSGQDAKLSTKSASDSYGKSDDVYRRNNDNAPQTAVSELDLANVSVASSVGSHLIKNGSLLNNNASTAAPSDGQSATVGEREAKIPVQNQTNPSSTNNLDSWPLSEYKYSCEVDEERMESSESPSITKPKTNDARKPGQESGVSDLNGSVHTPKLPPETKRKTNPQFFMGEEVPDNNHFTNNEIGENTGLRRSNTKNQPHKAAGQDNPSATDSSNADHLYAEINIRKPRSLSGRTGSDAVSVAMTSISSLTGRSSLFNIPDNYNSQRSNNVTNGKRGHLTGGENEYYDAARDAGTGLFEKLTCVINEAFRNTCRCFDGVVSGSSLPNSPSGTKYSEFGRGFPNSSEEKATVNATTANTVALTSSTKSGSINQRSQELPTFSSPMES